MNVNNNDKNRVERAEVQHKGLVLGFPHGPVAKNLPCNALDISAISGPGRFHMPQQPSP